MTARPPTRPAARPGGRSARVREAVLSAALDLLLEGRGSASLPEVAARAGVAPSSVYRRWGSWEGVVADALLARSEVEIPVPDTGTLRQDLIELATSVARYLASPTGYALTRAAVTLGEHPGHPAVRDRFWAGRLDRAAALVERARRRGEPVPAVPARVLLEMLVAPLHFRRLVTGQDVAADIAVRVDLLLGTQVARDPT